MNSKNADKRLERGGETYNRILASAMDIISESGVKGITASKLSALSNVSKSNIFHHFKTTQEIPEAVLHAIFNEMMRPIDHSKAENFQEFLRYLGSSIITISEEYKKVYKSFFSFYHESMFDETYRNIMRNFLEATKANLTHQLRNYLGEKLSDEEITACATLIISALDGIGLHILMGEDPQEYLKAWELQIKFICHSSVFNDGGKNHETSKNP